MSDTTNTQFSPNRPWLVIGAGRVGQTLGLLAARLGIPVTATWNRSKERADRAERVVAPKTALWDTPLAPQIQKALSGVDAPIIWITVADDAIESIGRQLNETVPENAIVFHTSGSISSSIFERAGISAAVGSVHPLQAISEPDRAVDRLGDSYWAVEGDLEAVEYARGLLGQIGVDPLSVSPEAKSAYHASAVIASNLVVGLLDAAIHAATVAGITKPRARAMLVTLAKTTLENLENQTPESALTGPAARGDFETIDRHLETLSSATDSKLVAVYRTVTDYLLAHTTNP